MPIKSDPKIKAGVPCIEGTRVTVGIVYMDYIESKSFKKVQDKFPQLTKTHIKEAVAYVTKIKNKNK